MEIRKKVNEFKTKNKSGFIKSEIEEILKDYPGINVDKFNDALLGITCTKVDGELVIYHCDIDKALRCGIENRGLTQEEFD